MLRSAIAMLRPYPSLKVGPSEGTSLRLLGEGVAPLFYEKAGSCQGQTWRPSGALASSSPPWLLFALWLSR